MEDYREKVHQRKYSCPLLVTDKTGNKFQIYDKDFIERKIDKKSPSDDKKVAPPPDFYPFTELDKLIEDA